MPPVFGPRVALSDPLVVPRGRHRHRPEPVAESQQRELLALQELLGDEPGRPEPALAEHRVDRVLRLRFARAHEDTLPRGEAVGLQHHRIERALPERTLCFLARARDRVGGGRHSGGGHQLLRVGLRPLDPRRRGGRAEGSDAGLAEHVHETGDERSLRSDDGEIHLLGCRRGDEPVELVDSDRQAPHAVRRHPRVTRRGEQLGRARTTSESVRQRMLSATGADDEDARQAQSAAMKSSTGIAAADS